MISLKSIYRFYVHRYYVLISLNIVGGVFSVEDSELILIDSQIFENNATQGAVADLRVNSKLAVEESYLFRNYGMVYNYVLYYIYQKI